MRFGWALTYDLDQIIYTRDCSYRNRRNKDTYQHSHMIGMWSVGIKINEDWKGPSWSQSHTLLTSQQSCAGYLIWRSPWTGPQNCVLVFSMPQDALLRTNFYLYFLNFTACKCAEVNILQYCFLSPDTGCLFYWRVCSSTLLDVTRWWFPGLPFSAAW